MPIYAYRCESCGFQKDALQKLSDAPLTDCPECGQPTLKKQVTAAGFQLKGSGWYVTDFRDGGVKAKPEAKSDAKPDPANAAGKSDKPSDSSPAAASGDTAKSGGSASDGASGSSSKDSPSASSPAPSSSSSAPSSGSSASSAKGSSSSSGSTGGGTTSSKPS